MMTASFASFSDQQQDRTVFFQRCCLPAFDCNCQGGGQALTIGFRRLDRFSAIGEFSAAAPDDFEKAFAQVLAAPEQTNAKLKVLWLACGQQDRLLERSRRLSALWTARGIKHTYRATEGAHVFRVWREYPGEFAPLLFR